MPKSNIIKALEELDKKDIYSLILFVLYRMKDDPQYSTLSELIYILDNDSFIRFLNYFGGQTLKVPKVSDLRNILNSICFYERKINTELSDDEILNELNIPKKDKKELTKTFNTITEIINSYEFKR